MANRTNVNFGIDLLAFAALLALISTGSLLYFVLPPGSGHRSLVWGLSRHEWGDVHGVAAVLMLTAIAVHLFLHARWIFAVVAGRRRGGNGGRILGGAAVVALLLGLAAAPLLSPVGRDGSSPPQEGYRPDHTR